MIQFLEQEFPDNPDFIKTYLAVKVQHLGENFSNFMHTKLGEIYIEDIFRLRPKELNAEFDGTYDD
jgi:hypothetical protein